MTKRGCGKKTKRGKRRKHTPIVSKKQSGAMGVAYAAKKGEIPVSKLKGPARQIYADMSAHQLKEHLEEYGRKRA
jgi:hypothetical protein